MRKIINSKTKQYETVSTDDLVLDDEPTPSSFNGITSDAVAKAIGNMVKYVDRYTSYSDVSAAISRGQLPIMTIVSGGNAYYYFPFYNGSGRIEFRSIQDGSINCFTWNGTAWVSGDSVIYGMGSDTKSEVDIDQGVLAIDGGNVVTKVTLATVNAVTFSVDLTVPAFAIEIDNTGNSNDVDVTVVNGATALKYSSAAGNQVGAGKYVQLTCVGGCWTLAEFEAPTP